MGSGGVMLDIPDVRQDHDYDCGAAVIAAVLGYYGVEPATLDDWHPWANPVQGTAPDTVEAAFRSRGLPCLSGTMDLRLLRHLTGRGRPVACLIQLHDTGHWVVVRGVEAGQVYYHCPVAGRSTRTRAGWLAGWHDGTRNAHEFTRWGVCPLSPRPPGSRVGARRRGPAPAAGSAGAAVRR